MEDRGMPSTASYATYNTTSPLHLSMHVEIN